MSVYIGLVIVPAGIVLVILRPGAHPPGTAGAAEVAGSSLTRLLLAIVVIVAVAKLAGMAMKAIGQPPVIGEIAAGILLGPSVLGMLWPEASTALFGAGVLSQISTLAQIGVVLFVFLAGVELNTRLLRGQETLAVVVSHVGIALPFLLGVVLAFAAHSRFAPADVGFVPYTLFMGVAMSVTALPVMARILKDTGLAKTRIGMLGLTCALVDDVTAWCLLALVIALVAATSASGVLLIIAMTAAFAAVLLWVVKPMLRRSDAYTERNPDRAVLLALVGLLLCALATEWIGVHAIFGAFLFGLMFPADGRLAKRVDEVAGGLTMALLLPLFFAFSGMRTQLGLIGLDWTMWMWFGVILAVAVIGKFAGTTFAARAIGTDWRTSLQIGTLMNCRGLTELIVLNIGLDLGVLSPELFTLMVLMALVSTAMAAPLLKALQPRGGPESPPEQPAEAPKPAVPSAA